jgi:hypothetical protein
MGGRAQRLLTRSATFGCRRRYQLRSAAAARSHAATERKRTVASKDPHRAHVPVPRSQGTPRTTPAYESRLRPKTSGKYRTPDNTKPRQITQKVESGAAARHRLYQASTANTAVPLAAAIAALEGTRGAAVKSNVTLTTRSASSFRTPCVTDCL